MIGRRWFAPLACALFSCSESADDARTGTLIDTFVAADQAPLRARPQLMVGKYVKMSGDLFDFYRGEVPLFAHDAHDPSTPLGSSRFAVALPLVASIGDSHPENFGVLWASDGTSALEQNDFDSADRVPYLFDLQRLVIGMVISARVSNPDDATANAAAIAASHDIARATASGYATEIARLAAGGAPVRLTPAVASADPFLTWLFGKALDNHDTRSELATNADGSAIDGNFTVIVNGQRQLRRGKIDTTDATSQLLDLPAYAYDALPTVIAQWRTTAANAPDAASCTVVDAARELGAGVSSYQKIRAIVLLRGATDDPSDDFLVEVKEITDAPSLVSIGPTVWADTVQARVNEMRAIVWSRTDADPLWGTSEWVGFPVQVRTESDGNKGLKTEKLVKDRGTPAAIETLGTSLGTLLARVHASTLPDDRSGGATPATAIAARIGSDLEGFLDEQADVGVAYGQLVVDDWGRFQAALVGKGPLLGFAPSLGDAPPPDLAALIATPLPRSDSP